MTRKQLESESYLAHPDWVDDRKAYWDYHKRLLSVIVPREVVLKLFAGDCKIKWSDTKWTLLDCDYDFDRQAIRFLLHHPNLPSVPEGQTVTQGRLKEVPNSTVTTFAVIWGT